MTDMRSGRLRAWLRPPRNLLVMFLAVVLLPAATLVVLDTRLLMTYPNYPDGSMM